MKKFISSLLAVTLMFSMCVVPAFAESSASTPTTTVTTTNPTTPVTPPKMEYTETIGPVTFSNYISQEVINTMDQNGEYIDVTRVHISDGGCMQVNLDNSQIYYYGMGDSWNTPYLSQAGYTKGYPKVGTTDNVFYSRGGINAPETLKLWGITPYPSTKTNDTWSKGLTWKFKHDAQYSSHNFFVITVEVNGQKHYYGVTVVKDMPAPPPATSATANPTTSNVMVNGKLVEFDAYNINNNNYFKLRDIAQAVRGTEKQFDVTWSTETGSVVFDPAVGDFVSKKGDGVIDMISGKAYVTVGGELKKGDGKAKTASLYTSDIYRNGTYVKITAYTINGNNYVKLRDLGHTFDFGVSWDNDSNAIVIDTTKCYTAD